MKTIRALLENYVLICTLSSWATAQVCKFLLTYFLNHEIRLERLSGAGGMPSAHSATVTALVISCARFEGIGSTFFAIAVALAAIVIYDAMGVRHEAGEHAKIINQMRKTARTPDEPEDPDFRELKEMLGHTPIEVVGGVLTGILVPLFIPVP